MAINSGHFLLIQLNISDVKYVVHKWNLMRAEQRLIKSSKYIIHSNSMGRLELIKALLFSSSQ